MVIMNSLNKILNPGSKGPDTSSFLVIIGDYGAGKTLLLDAATQKLAAQHVPVFFFCALDYGYNGKLTDDVLDIMFRSVITLTLITLLVFSGESTKIQASPSSVLLT